MSRREDLPVLTLRSLLFAPAIKEEMIAKLPSTGAGAVVIDCEDATPPNAKAKARKNARLLAPVIAEEGARVFVRVNAVASPWFEEDMAGALSDALEGVVVPKVESLEQLESVRVALSSAGHADLPILAGIETALGVADSRALLANRCVAAAYFGAEDFVADMGGVRSSGNSEVLYARSRVALAGRLAGVAVLDQVVTDFRNDEAFEREIAEARGLGYGGKLCIHPRQVELANRGFLPSAAELDQASRLLAAYASAAAKGSGVSEFEGQMVDEPLVARARRVIAMAQEGGDAR